jgi:YidC/Oxa1 family membrane protein insertase
MFTTLIVQPIFNLLVLIYALLPGHNFGLAIIIFTIIVRMAMWPLVKRQLHQTKLMRKMQPELKQIKKKAAGNKQKEQMMIMELYKERGVNPFATILILIPQFIVLIGLYQGLHRVVTHPDAIYNFAYSFLQHLPWMQQLATDFSQFDETLFGFVDLTKSATGGGSFYLPALIIVLASAAIQYFQSKQLLPDAKEGRKLRHILKAAGDGQQADQAEVQAAVSRMTILFLPVMIVLVTIGLPSALGLYWLVGGIVAIIQQSIILREDEEELEALANAPDSKQRNLKNIPEAEVVSEPAKPGASSSKNKKSGKKKRRKR